MTSNPSSCFPHSYGLEIATSPAAAAVAIGSTTMDYDVPQLTPLRKTKIEPLNLPNLQEEEVLLLCDLLLCQTPRNLSSSSSASVSVSVSVSSSLPSASTSPHLYFDPLLTSNGFSPRRMSPQIWAPSPQQQQVETRMKNFPELWMTTPNSAFAVLAPTKFEEKNPKSVIKPTAKTTMKTIKAKRPPPISVQSTSSFQLPFLQTPTMSFPLRLPSPFMPTAASSALGIGALPSLREDTPKPSLPFPSFLSPVGSSNMFSSPVDFSGFLTGACSQAMTLPSISPLAYNLTNLSVPLKEPIVQETKESSDTKKKSTRALKPSSMKCQVPFCTKRNQGNGKCRAHGGGKRCLFKDCEKSAQRGPYCSRHGGVQICTFPGCSNNVRAQHLCAAHGGGKRCKLEGCDRPCRKKGLCTWHYNRLQKNEMSLLPEEKTETRSKTAPANRPLQKECKVVLPTTTQPLISSGVSVVPPPLPMLVCPQVSMSLT